MTRRSDSLTALVHEAADLTAVIASDREGENVAQMEFVAARQALDSAKAQREANERRLEATMDAVSAIRERDDVSKDVVDAMLKRARR